MVYCQLIQRGLAVLLILASTKGICLSQDVDATNQIRDAQAETDKSNGKESLDPFEGSEHLDPFQRKEDRQRTPDASVSLSSHQKISYRIILDQKMIRFADIVYGFLSVQDKSGNSSYLPFPKAESNATLRLRCSLNELKNDIGPGGMSRAIPVKKKPANAFSVEPFQFNWLNSDIVDAVRDGCECSVRSELRIRPLAILKETDDPERPYAEEVLGEHEDAVIEAVATLKYDTERTIFQNPDRELSRFLLNPAAWRSRETVNEMFYWSVNRSLKPVSQAEQIRLAAIQSVPVLAVFPERYKSILPDLDRDTATWRYLEISRLTAELVREQPSDEDMTRLVRQANDVLKQSGPAELFLLEKGFFNQVQAFWAIDDQALTPEERSRGRSKFVELWSTQMERSFPNVPLYYQSFATKSGRDFDPHKIDIEYVKRLLDRNVAQ